MNEPWPQDLRREVSRELGLQPVKRSHWADTNADGGRLVEFINYYFRKQDSAPREMLLRLMQPLIIKSSLRYLQDHPRASRPVARALRRFGDQVGFRWSPALSEESPEYGESADRLHRLLALDPVFTRLSDSLGLPWHDQDWGLINADPNRIDEFLEYYKNIRPTIPKNEDYGFVSEMADLICYSASEYLITHVKLTAETEVALIEFWREVRHHAALEYNHFVDPPRDTLERCSPEGDPCVIGDARLARILRAVDKLG